MKNRGYVFFCYLLYLSSLNEDTVNRELNIFKGERNICLIYFKFVAIDFDWFLQYREQYDFVTLWTEIVAVETFATPPLVVTFESYDQVSCQRESSETRITLLHRLESQIAFTQPLFRLIIMIELIIDVMPSRMRICKHA